VFFCVEVFRVSFRGLKLNTDFPEYAVFRQLDYGGDNAHSHKRIEWSE